uniref:Ig-like domain-containing protein n=1 Tax=Astatotilapia calliptera TaxID=8154 RepID=A0AAX7UV64_ASTCA
ALVELEAATPAACHPQPVDFSHQEQLSAQLQVFIPSDVFVREGEDAILPCRSITAGQWVKSVRWRRDGEVVLDVRSGKTTYGNGFDESRVSIPSDWHQRANLSLIIKRAEARDGGVYYCDIDKVEKHRSAVRLHVSTPPTPPSTTSQPTTTERDIQCVLSRFSLQRHRGGRRRG